MSSLRNAVHRREHKERHQPKHRERFGFLEKKKDYKIRAKEYHRKADTIQKLRQKASFRNPDEFYFKMESSKRVDGIHLKDDKTHKYSPAELEKMKTQDMTYLTMKRGIETKKISKLQENLHFLDLSSRKHTVFVDDSDEVESFDPATYFETKRQYIHRTFNRPLQSTLTEGSVVVNEDILETPQKIQKLNKVRAKAYRELNIRMEREEQLKQAIDVVYLQKQIINSPNGKKKLKKRKSRKNMTLAQLEGSKVGVCKWRRDRKK